MILRRAAHRLASVVATRTLTEPELGRADGVPVEGGHPAEDLPGTWRQHKGDNPGDCQARRWVKDDSGETPWILITGWGRDAPSCLDDDEMVGWSRVCGPPPR